MVGTGPLRRAELMVAGDGRSLISITSGLPEYEAAAEAFTSDNFQTAFDLDVRRNTAIEIVSKEFGLILASYEVQDLTFPSDPSESVSWDWSDDYATRHQLARVFPDWVPQSNGTLTLGGEFVLRPALPNGESALAVSSDLRTWETTPDLINRFGPLLPWGDSYLATVDGPSVRGSSRPIPSMTGLRSRRTIQKHWPRTMSVCSERVTSALCLFMPTPIERTRQDRVVVETDEGSISLDPSSGLVVAAQGPTWRMDFSNGLGDLARYSPATDQIELFMPGDTRPLACGRRGRPDRGISSPLPTRSARYIHTVLGRRRTMAICRLLRANQRRLHSR